MDCKAMEVEVPCNFLIETLGRLITRMSVNGMGVL
jgi:hypothetical protein